MSRAILIPLFAFALLVIPSFAFAADASFFGPIVPTECSGKDVGGTICPCSFAAVLETVRHVINIVISLAIAIATVLLAWAGISFMINGTNEEKRKAARGMVMNVIIGIVIVLGAWLIVDFVMKTLYSGMDGNAGLYGPWNSIIKDNGSFCIEEKNLKPLFDGPIDTKPGSGDPSAPDNPNPEPSTPGEPVDPGTVVPGADGSFTYQGGIQAQAKHASSQLNLLLTCMANKVPADVGQISSISDSLIVDNKKTFTQCIAGQCQHAGNSCHYGGPRCSGASYAVDFGDGGKDSLTKDGQLKAAAKACGANYTLTEKDHLHVSIGERCGCN